MKYTNKHWTIANGKVLKIRTMDEYHINNCINMINKTTNDSRKSFLPIFEAELKRRRVKPIDNYKIY